MELTAAFASSEVDNTDVVTGYAMQKRAEKAAHYGVEEVAVKVVAGTHDAVAFVVLDG